MPMRGQTTVTASHTATISRIIGIPAAKKQNSLLRIQANPEGGFVLSPAGELFYCRRMGMPNSGQTRSTARATRAMRRILAGIP